MSYNNILFLTFGDEMKNIFSAFLTILIVLLAGCERKPSPSDYMAMKAARKEFKRHRKEWIEEMHRAAEGVNWRTIDRETRRAKTERRLANRGDGRSLDKAMIHGLHGHWNERGSNNLAGRMHTTDVDFDMEYIYCGSSGGNVWRGNLDGSHWTCLNGDMQINDIKMVRLIPHDDGKRLIVAGSWPGIVYYTDDDGATWNTSAGLDVIGSWGGFRSGQIVNDSFRSIYLLGTEWDYIHWTERVVVYKSTDHAASFTKIYDYGLSSNLYDLWTSRFDSTGVYMLVRETLTKFTDTDELDTIAAFAVTGGISEVRNINLTGCAIGGAITFYSAHAYGDHTDIHRSTDGGATWAYRSEIDETPFLSSGNNFTCSNNNPNNVFFGAVQCYRSHNGAGTWAKHNEWWEYYDNPEDLLHADIPGVDAIRTPGGPELLYISTDGGLYVSHDSLLSVNNLSLNGLAVSQYYSTYTCRFDPDYIYVGSQDQGYQRCQSDSGGMLDFDQLISGDYGHIVSSDGGSSIWSDYPGFVMYYPNAMSSEWKVTWDFVGSNYLWLPPLMEDPSAVDKCYIGGGGSDGGAHIWHLDARLVWISADEEPFDFSLGEENVRVSAMEYSPINPTHRYVLTNDGNFFRSTDVGATWTHTPSFVGPESHYFYGSSIVASPITLGTVYIAGSGYSNPPVYVSTDDGSTFEPMDDGLPSTLVYEIAITPDEKLLFAATEVGAYAYIFDEERWFDIAELSAPDQTYWTVDYIDVISTARFGTYGRGIWDFVVDSLVGVEETAYVALPTKIALKAYPNPFNSEVKIEFELPRASDGELKIFDSMGRLVALLHDGEFVSGKNAFIWNGETFAGRMAPSGNYLALLNIGELNSNIKLTLVK